MTVTELIKRLQELPGELEVYTIDSEYGADPVDFADVQDSYPPKRSVVLQ